MKAIEGLEIGTLEKLKANQLFDLVRQFSGGFILIEVAV